MTATEDLIIHFFNFAGHVVCHQIPERTLWIGGRYLPVCSRDTGAYLGLCIGYLLLPLRKKDAYGPPNLWITFFMVVPMIVDSATQTLGVRTSTNELRLITGLIFGVALAPFLVYLVSLVPLSRKLPIVQGFLPKSVRLDDKEPWLNSQSLGLGLLMAVALFFAVNSVVGSTSPIFYWLLSPLIVCSVVWHIFLLPLFLALSLFAYLKTLSSSSSAS